jgi:hypothetical protein
MVVVGDDIQFKQFVAQYILLLDLDVPDKKAKRKQNSGQVIDEFGVIEEPVKIDRKKMDVRVYLIPQKESTIGHYLAMHDDLYCHNIYNFFNQNTFLGLTT